MEADELARKVVERLRRSNIPHEVVADFVDVKRATVAGWLAGDGPPNGERMNRLWYLLEAAGIPSPEMDKVPPFGQYLGRLLAYQVIDMKQARVAYKPDDGEGGSPQAVLNAIRGEQNPLKPTPVDELAELYGDQLAAKEQELQEMLAVFGAESSPLAGAEVPTQAPMQATGLSKDQIYAIVRELSSGLAAVRILSSEDATDEDRALVRALMGERNMFDYANLLNRLCSTRAFNQ